MIVLGVETSCDETGLAVLALDFPVGAGVGDEYRPPQARLLAQALHSQVDLHRLYGGVVPELASRDHLLRLMPLLEGVLREAGRDLHDLGLIGVTQGPGLAGALLVGCSFAYGLAAALDCPVVPVHHLEGHLLSPLFGVDSLTFPFVALLVSGGHTQLLRADKVGEYQLLGETIDDAAGEAFDKTAQLLGLGYPGGPEVARLAESGQVGRFSLPRPLLGRPTLDLSFAGLKTAVLTQVRKAGGTADLSAVDRADIAAEAQQAIVDVLVAKSIAALKETGVKSLVVAGGVSANQLLRQSLDKEASKLNASVYYPPLNLCTDNGVMIAWAAGLRAAQGDCGSPAGAFSVRPRWPLSERQLPAPLA